MKSIKYLYSNAITVVMIVSLSWFVSKYSYSFEEALILAWVTFYLLFDYTLNWFRNKPILQYYGNLDDEGNLSFIERVVYTKLSWQALYVIKKILFIFGVILYYSNTLNFSFKTIF